MLVDQAVTGRRIEGGREECSLLTTLSSQARLEFEELVLGWLDRTQEAATEAGSQTIEELLELCVAWATYSCLPTDEGLHANNERRQAAYSAIASQFHS